MRRLLLADRTPAPNHLGRLWGRFFRTRNKKGSRRIHQQKRLRTGLSGTKGGTMAQQKRRPFTEERETLVTLLDNWDNYFEVATSGTFALKTEDPNKPMSKDWTIISSMSRYPSVVELCRVLDKLSRLQPNHCKHLCAYFASPTKTVDEEALVASPQNPRKKIKVPVRVSKRVVPRWVLPRMVELGLVGLAWYWDSSVVLELPPALNRRLREFTDQDGTHLTEAA